MWYRIKHQNKLFRNRTAGPLINTIQAVVQQHQEGESYVKFKKPSNQPRGWSTDPSGSKQRTC